jgi:hypothetical protein
MLLTYRSEMRQRKGTIRVRRDDLVQEIEVLCCNVHNGFILNDRFWYKVCRENISLSNGVLSF